MTMKKKALPWGLLVVLLSFCMAVSLFGCGSNDNKEKTDSLGLTTSYELQGVSFGINPDWEIRPTNDACTYIRIGNDKGVFTLQTVLHGQTKELSSAWSEFYSGADVPEELRSWSDSGVDYIEGIVRKSTTSYMILAGTDNQTGKGFALSFVVNHDELSEADEIDFFDGVVSTLKYDSSKTTADYREVVKANNGTSTSGSSSSKTSSATSSSSSSQIAGSSSGSYLVGKDLPAGEYKLTTSSKGSCTVWSDAAKTSLLGARSFSVCSYITLSEGTVAEYSNAIFTPIDSATPTTPRSGSGEYKVGFDMPAGTYKITASNRGGYMVYPDSSPQPHIASAGSIHSGSDYAAVSDGQYISIEGEAIEAQ